MQGLRGVSVVHPHSVVHIRARKVNQGFDDSRCRRHVADGYLGAITASHGLIVLIVSEDAHDVRDRQGRIRVHVCLELTRVAGSGRKRLRHRASRAVNRTKCSGGAGGACVVDDGAVLIIADPVQRQRSRLRCVGYLDGEGKLAS